KNNVDLQMHPAADLPLVLGDRVQIQQVLMNLILNAIDAIRSVAARPRELSIVSRAGEESAVCVEVTDTGVGIAREDVEKVFEPFLTSKPSGMGMGLSICRTIIENHGGSLRVVPDHTPGACFRFTLEK